MTDEQIEYGHLIYGFFIREPRGLNYATYQRTVIFGTPELIEYEDGEDK